MSSRCPDPFSRRRTPRTEACPHLAPFGLVLLLAACAGSTAAASPAPERELRVCADPNNLPFTNDRLEGFENRIAALVARDMQARVRYTWWAQRRGFIRNTLKAGLCDVVIGLPADMDLVLTTRPYYRSTYVFIARTGAGPRIRSFDDPALRRLRIGVQIIGDDYANAPPAHALAQRHITSNVVGFTVYGNYAQPNPPARVVDAVASGEVDLAVAWGPLAGYFAARQKVPLTVTPVSPQIDRPWLPFVFDIAMGVRRGDTALKGELERILVRRRREIDAILAEYRVPRVDPPAETVEPGRQSRRTAEPDGAGELDVERAHVDPGLQARRTRIPGGRR
jgi:mxaJ protein